MMKDAMTLHLVKGGEVILVEILHLRRNHKVKNGTGMIEKFLCDLDHDHQIEVEELH